VPVGRLPVWVQVYTNAQFTRLRHRVDGQKINDE